MSPKDCHTGLTAERLRVLLDYEPATGVFRWRVWRPNGVKVGDRAGSLDHKGHRIIKIDGRNYRSGRLAWLWMTGAMPERLVDHENRIRDDDRWENLREATDSQNCANRLTQNKNGFKGVVYRKSRDRYEAYLKKDGRRRFLGYFLTADAAGAAYAASAVEHFGDYARS